MNNKHTVLAVKDNVRISLGHKDPTAPQMTLPNVDTSERIERMALANAAESKERSSEFLKLVVTTLESARERESNMHAANMAMMGQFFSNIQTAAASQFQQTLLMLTTGHRQTLEQMALVEDGRERRQLAAGKKKEDGGETKMVDMLLKGMRLASDMNSGNQPQMWEQLAGAGAALLSKVGSVPAPAAAALPALAPPSPPGPAPRVLSSKAKATIQKALRLYREVRSRGIDPDVLLASLSEVADERATEAPVPPPPDPSDDDEDSDEGEDESDEDLDESEDFDDEEDEPESDSEHGDVRA